MRHFAEEKREEGRGCNSKTAREATVKSLMNVMTK